MLYLIVILSYLIGSVPFALVVGKFFYKIDVREHNSHNLGATNTLVTLGKKAGVVVALGDILKGVLACYLPFIFNVDINPLWIGFLAIIGHCYPIFAGFRGGKAVATTFGVLLVIEPLLFLLAVASFFLFIFITKYVFFGSLSIGVTSILYSIIIHNELYLYTFFCFSIFMIYLHRSNIKNFINHTEPTIKSKK